MDINVILLATQTTLMPMIVSGETDLNLSDARSTVAGTKNLLVVKTKSHNVENIIPLLIRRVGEHKWKYSCSKDELKELVSNKDQVVVSSIPPNLQK